MQDNTSTTGVIRYDLSGNSNYVNNGAYSYESNLGLDIYDLLGMINPLQRNTTDVYNIYVVNQFAGESSLGGFVQYMAAGHGQASDGTFLRASGVGRSMVLAHEFGHSVSLYHTFQDTDPQGTSSNWSCGIYQNGGYQNPLQVAINHWTTGDRVADTSPTINGNTYNSYYGTYYPTNLVNKCTDNVFDDVINNVMSYGANPMTKFTIGQMNRAVENFLNYRSSFITSLAALPPINSSLQPIVGCIPQQITGVGGLSPNSGYNVGIQYFEFGSIKNRSSLHYGPNPVFYTDYTSKNNINSGYIAEVSREGVYTVTLGTSSMQSVKYTVFIDYNNDGVFQESERVINNLVLAAGPDWNTLSTVTNTITIPVTATLNTPLRMRVIGDFNSGVVSMGACDDRYLGEVEDYTVIVKDGESPCGEITDNFGAYASEEEGKAGSLFDLKSYGFDESPNLTYQWQKSVDGQNWQNIANATSKSFVATTEEEIDGTIIYYRLKVDCSASNNTYYSNRVTRVTKVEYCEGAGYYTNLSKISNVNFAGINNASISGAGYEDFTYIQGNASKNNVYTFSTTFTEANYLNLIEIIAWIDYNKDGVFNDNERLFVSTRNELSSDGQFTKQIQIPNDALLGKTRMRIRLYYKGQNDGFTGSSCGVSNIGQVEDYTINITSGNETIWENQAWSNGIPTLDKEAIIKDHLVVTSGEIVAKKLTIEAGSLTLNEGTVLRLEDELINQLTADKVVFEDGAYLIQNNPIAINTGNVTYKRNSTPIYRLETLMWSSPVDGQKIGEISQETLANRFTRYNENANNWEIININNDFVKGEMIAFRSPNTFANYISPNIPGRIFTGNFIGTPFNGDTAVPTTVRNSSQGYNGIGNPYASPISLEAFFNAPANAATNIEALYFWTREHKIINGSYQNGVGSNWITYNRLGWSNGSNLSTLNAAQGFIVKVQNAGNLYFSNNMRTVSTNNVSNRASDISKYWLELTKENETVNSILIGYIDGSTIDYEVNFDAKPIETGDGLYSLIGQEKFLIQGRGNQLNINDVVPLTIITATSGEYQIKLNNPQGDFITEIIYLIDKSTNRTINLSEEGSYQFTIGTGEFTDRFEIAYQNRSLNTSEINNQDISIYTQDKEVKINSKEIIRTVDVFDFEGRLLQNNTKVDAKIFSTSVQNQKIVIVKVTLVNGKIITKKIILQ